MTTKLVLIMAVLFSVNAQADLGTKAPLKADFRSLIDNSYQERSFLANGVSEEVARRPKAEKKNADTRRVTDFVDVEIGWGEAPKMVDRRFDSVEEDVRSN